MSRTPLFIALGTATAVVAAMAAGPAVAAQPTVPTAQPAAAPAAAANAVIASRPAALKAAAHDAFQQRNVYQSDGLNYVSYDRTYKGLPVKGGDLVIVTDAAGATKFTSVAQQQPIGELSTTPTITDAAALATAKRQLKTVAAVEGTRLIVVASENGAAKLAWESTIRGTSAEGVSRLTVDVDATTGKVIGKTENVTEATGTGTGWINGSVSLNTTQSGSTYTLKDPGVTNLSCQDSANNRIFSGPDNSWGNGVGTNKETGCVDALYVAQKQFAMLSQWLGRNGQNGNGGAWPIRVGLNDQNAYYDGTQVQIGKNTANQWISSADVVGHELGHGIDDKTPGGISKAGTQEFVADTFGAATEWYINNPNDAPDYLVGEEVNLVGSGPIRNMANPAAVGDANCYTSSTGSGEVHSAAGPGNRWFALVAQGSVGEGTGTASCPKVTGLTGIGIQSAIKIMYNAMLMKTSSSSYPKYRLWTLQAAKNISSANCTAVKNAWNAVKVPVQSGEPTC